MTPEPSNELAAVRNVIARMIAPDAERVDQTSTFPGAAIRALAEAGAGGLLMPVEYGGQARPTREYAEAMELISAACGATATVYMTQMHCAHPINLAGTPQQVDQWIPALCSGAAIGAIALTESDAGSDVAAMRTVATRHDDHYVVNGSKIFISNGDMADVIVLFATVDPVLGKDGITAFLVATENLQGFDAGRPMKKLGQKGASTVELTFTDCRIPVDWRLGDEGAGYPLLLRSVLNSRISASAQGVGFAQGAFDATVRHLMRDGLLSAQRRDAQDLQFDLARIRSEIAAGRALVREVCDLVDSGAPEAAAEVSVAKLHCTALGVRVAAECVALLGDDGDRCDLGVERRLRDAKITEIYDGTNQVQSMLIARDIRISAAAVQ
ncbi:acyl-CoA dehydrogenase family protein [Nocardia sp. CA-107356]|uniref:acyl-CoA dehydrogenase family protein n=1 Tax=Nocardia sp. CA-107356 TaxID=3239972 RepID=UPI003D94E375